MRISDWSSDVCSSDLAHCHGPSGSSAEMRKCASRRAGACIPPAGATAVIAGASVVEADLVDKHAGLAAVAYHFGQRPQVDLHFTEARDTRVEFAPGLHRGFVVGRAEQSLSLLERNR